MRHLGYLWLLVFFVCLVSVVWLCFADSLDDTSLNFSLVFFTRSGRQYVNQIFMSGLVSCDLAILYKAYFGPFGWTLKYIRGSFCLFVNKQETTIDPLQLQWRQIRRTYISGTKVSRETHLASFDFP